MWEDFEFDADKVPNIKLGIHIAQFVFSLVIWILEIVVFRADGSTITGLVGWTFAVCFLSIPAWLYLAGAPRFPRTRHLAEPHVMVVVDSIYAILWLSAFATQASYNTANLCGSACGTSKAIVGLGFFVFLFFCVTTFLSIYSLKYHQFNGRLPGYDRIQAKNQNIDPDKAAFSMTPHGHGDEAYAPIHGQDLEHDPMDPRDDHGGYNSAYGGADHSAYGGAASSQQGSTGYGGGRQSSPYGDDRQGSPYGGGRQPSPYAAQDDPYGQRRQENPFDQGRQDNNPFEDHVGYTPPASGSGSHSTPTPVPSAGGAVMLSAGIYVPPTAQDETYDDGRPVQFPAGNYDRALH